MLAADVFSHLHTSSYNDKLSRLIDDAAAKLNESR